jgi:hypothetical protein
MPEHKTSVLFCDIGEYACSSVSVGTVNLSLNYCIDQTLKLLSFDFTYTYMCVCNINVNFLCPWSIPYFEAEDPTNEKASYITEFLQVFSSSRSKEFIVVTSCCYSDTVILRKNRADFDMFVMQNALRNSLMF